MNEPVIRRSIELMEAELDDEIVGLDLEQGTCFGFNATATTVWKQLEQPSTRAALLETLLQEYDVEAPACAAELDLLLADLTERGMIEVVPPQA